MFEKCFQVEFVYSYLPHTSLLHDRFSSNWFAKIRKMLEVQV